MINAIRHRRINKEVVMATILILLIMAGCAAIQFQKGNLVKSFATFMAALCAGIIAFAWYEQAADLLIKQEMLTDWAQAISFVILFVIAFAILQTLSLMLLKQPIDLGIMPERVGRIVFGLFAGIVISGCLLAAAAMAPMSNNFPYQRFDSARPDSQNPHKPLLNPDGFIARWFGLISKGSLSGSKSFAVLHSGLLDQLFLNRLAVNKNLSTLADSGSIEIPAKAAAWPAPEGLKDNTGTALSSKPDQELIIVRVGFTARMLKSGGAFTPGQLRLICKQKNDKQRFEGSAVTVYPVGYIKTASQLQRKGLGEQIQITGQNIKDSSCPIDFAFYIPAGFEPIAVEFKANVIAEVPPMVTAEQAPKPVMFIQTTGCATGYAKVAPVTSA